MTLSLPVAQEKYTSDVDLFSHASLMDPYADYKTLRDVGRVAYMARYDMWTVTRYDEVKQLLGDPETFCSSQGIGMNSVLNTAWKDFAPCKDGAEHAPMRRLMMQTMGPKAVSAYRSDVQRSAVELVDEVVERGEFDAVTDFAQMMPMRVFLDVLGLSPDVQTRRDMLHWATDTYNCAGPDGTFADTLPSMDKLYGFAIENIKGDALRPGSIGALTWEAAERGDITKDQAVGTIAAYVTAGLDTTAGTLGSLMMLFTQNPDQWAIVRDDPSIVPSAVYEGLRMEAVAQWFTRVTTRDVEYDDIVIPEGSRVLHSYGAANRDERRYPDPDRFDVRRNPTDLLTFGYGPHSCAGKSLSRLEMNALITELAKRVDRIEPLGPPQRHLNNLIRSLDSLPVRIHHR